jgi:hypothetical protein
VVRAAAADTSWVAYLPTKPAGLTEPTHWASAARIEPDSRTGDPGTGVKKGRSRHERYFACQSITPWAAARGRRLRGQANPPGKSRVTGVTVKLRNRRLAVPMRLAVLPLRLPR